MRSINSQKPHQNPHEEAELPRTHVVSSEVALKLLDTVLESTKDPSITAQTRMLREKVLQMEGNWVEFTAEVVVAMLGNIVRKDIAPNQIASIFSRDPL